MAVWNKKEKDDNVRKGEICSDSGGPGAGEGVGVCKKATTTKNKIKKGFGSCQYRHFCSLLFARNFLLLPLYRPVFTAVQQHN